ncbi:hypothetical protein BGX28_003749 [Mortierella sp. GBA30]|nr:hypothetical protein BGX28_003749 [Mortierella sp. GBA30]
MEKALALPEILGDIKEYLDKDDILHCILVCGLWNNAFSPHLWRTFTINSAEQNIILPSLKQMERNAPYIRKLTVHDIELTHGTFYRNCSQLEDLTLAVYFSYEKNDEREIYWDFLAGIINELPRLLKIAIMRGAFLPTLSFYKALSGCPQLIALETDGGCFPGENCQEFMRICSTNMRRLVSNWDTFDSRFSFADNLTFPQMQHLEIRYAQEMTISAQLEWISRCPNLVSVGWKTHDVPDVKFSKILTTTCPNVRDLELCFDICDADIALILNNLPKIERLSLSGPIFDQLSTTALRRHFPWLKDIDCDDLTSAAVQEILCSCPALQSIRADILKYGDIAASPMPWACKRLQTFDVEITIGGITDSLPDAPSLLLQQPHESADEEERLSMAHRDIYQRLAQLTELRYLRMSHVYLGKVRRKYHVKLTMEAGLGALATLKWLRRFRCARAFNVLTRQEIVETVKWMLKHWMHLEVLGASIEDRACKLEVQELLTKERVKFRPRIMDRALMLPEILVYIGEHLAKNDILHCILVCRLWKQAFGPYLWRSFTLWDYRHRHTPDLHLMELNAPYIRSLDCRDIVLEHETFYRNCCQLRVLTILIYRLCTESDERAGEYWGFLSDIIKTLPHLQEIVITRGSNPLTLKFVSAMSECRKLIALQTYGSRFQQEKDTEQFLRVSSSNLKRLVSHSDTFSASFVFPDDLWFPKMQHLEISYAYGMIFDTQLKWVSRCPNLISICWSGSFCMSVTKFCKIIPVACPQLTELHLHFRRFRSGAITRILCAVPRIEKLSLSGSPLDPFPIDALQRHFPWLKDIVCYSMTSPMVQGILCSCAALQSISAKLIQYEDIVASPMPWVCKGLQTFDVSIALSTAIDGISRIAMEERLSNACRDIFSRFGQLTELRYLLIGYQDVGMGLCGVKLTLESGLDALATLKRLRKFSCERGFESLTNEQAFEIVKWMLEHWKYLEELQTSWHGNEGGIIAEN